MNDNVDAALDRLWRGSDSYFTYQRDIDIQLLREYVAETRASESPETETIDEWGYTRAAWPGVRSCADQRQAVRQAASGWAETYDTPHIVVRRKVGMWERAS
jgi:hypothetical protein